jgi:hypothetical protein
MSIEPLVHRGLGLFDEPHAVEAGALRGFEGERAGAFVERRGDREDDLLLRERMLWVFVIPRGGDVAEIARARFDGSQLFALATRREGTFAPSSSASRPTISPSVPQGRTVSPGPSSPSAG